MALTYFIDGYNLIQSDWRLAKGPFDGQRKGLLALLQAARIPGGNRVYLVFDGKPGPWSPESTSDLKVIFTDPTDADTWIKRKVDAMTQPKNAVVVTNDRAIQFWVKGAGAQVMPCKTFLARIQHSGGRKKGSGLSARERADINEELRKEWGD